MARARSWDGLLGQALSRRWRNDSGTVIWLLGGEGSGKSTATALARDALGDAAISLSADWFARPSGEIDATLTAVLERQPRVIVSTEVERLALRRLLAMTGHDGMTARKPHGPLVEGTVRAAFLLGARSMPSLPMTTGMRRRSVYLPCERCLDDARRAGEIDALPDDMSELQDALLTAAILAAQDCYRADYEAPLGDAEFAAEQVSAADPVLSFAQALPKSRHGSALQTVLMDCREATGLPSLERVRLLNSVEECGWHRSVCKVPGFDTRQEVLLHADGDDTETVSRDAARSATPWESNGYPTGA